MAQDKKESLQRITRVFEDTIADTAKLREGLTDDEAIPLVNWGVAYGKALAFKMTLASENPPDDQQVSDQAYNLARMLTRLNWIATYRDKKDASWLTQTLLMVNKLSQELLGPAAPVMPEDKIASWLPAQSRRPTREVLGDLMAQFTPSSSKESAKGMGDILTSLLGEAFSPPIEIPASQESGADLLGMMLGAVLGGDSTPGSAGPGSTSQDGGSALLGSVIDSVLGGDQTAIPSQPGSPPGTAPGTLQDAGSTLLSSAIDAVLGGGQPSAQSAPPTSTSAQDVGSTLLSSAIDAILGESQPSAQSAPPTSTSAQDTGSTLLSSAIDAVLGEGQPSAQSAPPTSTSTQNVGSTLLSSAIDAVLGGASQQDSASQDDDQSFNGSGLPGHTSGSQKEKPSQNPLSRLFRQRRAPGRGAKSAESPEDSKPPQK